jgi:hypothetical protein
LSRGIRAEVVDGAFAGIEEPLPVVIERDRAQAEVVETLETYLSKRITRTVIRNGREALARHKQTLQRISATYGVSPAVIVGVWGFESNFGRFSGVRPTVAGAGHAGMGPAAVHAVSLGTVRERSRSSTVGTSTCQRCADRGPGRWANRSSCRRAT